MSDKILKTLNGYTIYDEEARTRITSIEKDYASTDYVDEAVSQPVNALADGKVDKNQGTENNGKFLGVVDGYLVLVDAPSGTSGTTDVVRCVAQELTEEQQEQVRANIGAASMTEFSALSEQIVDLKNNSNVANREILPNVVLFGDSITDTKVNGEWVKNIEDYAEFKSLTNYARGYCTFTFKSDSEYNITDTSNANIGNNVIWNQYNRMKADVESGGIDTPDCIIILGGTNDALQSKTIGDKDTAFTGSILNTDIKTLTNLYQSIRYVCETIKQNFPSTQIILCTPLQLGSSYNDNIISVHDAIVNSAQKMALKYIDQTYESGIYSYEEINGDVSLQNDNIHLSALGGKLVAQFLAREFYNKINLRYSQISEDEEPDTPIEPEVTLLGISATYNGGTVSVGTELSSLAGIIVTATYSDGTTEIVTDYTLSGTITKGSNTITVTYEGLTTTFTVVGEEEIEVTLTSINANYTGGEVEVGTSLTSLTGITVIGTWSDGTTSEITGYKLSGEIIEGVNTITVSYNDLTTTFDVVGVAESTGDEEEIPSLYRLESPFVGNGEDTMLDSGLCFEDVDKDFSIFIDYEATRQRALDVLLTTMYDASPWYGIYIGCDTGMVAFASASKWTRTSVAFDRSNRVILTHKAGSDEYVGYVNSLDNKYIVSQSFNVNTYNAQIGGQKTPSGTQRNMQGTISQCNIYGKVLSTDEITALLSNE